MPTQFRNREEAGKFLAQQLTHYRGHPDVVVLALPRGGVPVAFPIATRLEVPMDIFIVRKLGVPIYEELAMGAIASGGVRVINEEVVRKLGVTPQMIDAVVAEQQRELVRREREYRGNRTPIPIAG